MQFSLHKQPLFSGRVLPDPYKSAIEAPTMLSSSIPFSDRTTTFYKSSYIIKAHLDSIHPTLSPMSSSEELIRPEHILQLFCLPGPSKVKHFDTVTNLWLKLCLYPKSFSEYQEAYKKLFLVSDIVRAAIARSEMEQAARKAEVEGDNALGNGSKTCGICLEPFRLGRAEQANAMVGGRASLIGCPVTLDCGDTCCYHCLSLWLKNHTRCPALGCGVDFGDPAVVQANTDAQVFRYDHELGEVLDLM